MKKIQSEWTQDYNRVPCLRVSCRRGRLNAVDVYEHLQHNYPGFLFVHLVKIHEDTPMDLYDEGDEWDLYEPFDIVKSLIQYTGDCYAGKESS